MVYRGQVKNGVVVLQDNANLPEGTEVSVEPLETLADDRGAQEGPSLYERLKPFIGSAKGLPSDASARIDEYLYGDAGELEE